MNDFKQGDRAWWLSGVNMENCVGMGVQMVDIVKIDAPNSFTIRNDVTEFNNVEPSTLYRDKKVALAAAIKKFSEEPPPPPKPKTDTINRAPEFSLEYVSTSLALRFWKYTKVSGEHDCWEWVGSLDKGGYGQINEKGKVLKAHRVSYLLHFGNINSSNHICHTCNNTRCVSPFHLYSGDNFTNTKDRMDAKTQYKIPPMRGINNYQTHFSWEDILFIRDCSIAGNKLADFFGVSAATISNIRRGKIWKKQE